MNTFFQPLRTVGVKFLDIIVFLVLLAGCTLFLVRSFFVCRDLPQYVCIVTASSHYIYPVFKDGEYVFTGELGEFRIKCENNEVCVVKTNCPGKTCMNKKIYRTGDSIICLPNMISIYLSENLRDDFKRDESKIDSLSY